VRRQSELRERREREEERRAEAEGMGAELTKPFSSPRPASWHLGKRSENALCLCLSFVVSFVIHHGTGLGGWQREACNERHRADSGGETVKMYAAIV
jgi:hypothetical protein